MARLRDKSRSARAVVAGVSPANTMKMQPAPRKLSGLQKVAGLD